VVSLDSICHLNAPAKLAVQQAIDARVRRKVLVPVTIEGAEKQAHWVRPEALGTAGNEYPAPALVHILSPFDPLIIQRKRTHLFFDYEHRFEAYVPKERRRFGYFALPVLAGDTIVAAIDLKTERKAQRVVMQKWTWLADRPRATLKRRIEEALHRFEAFQLADLPPGVRQTEDEAILAENNPGMSSGGSDRPTHGTA